MLNIEQIEKYYPENLHAFKKGMLREYLQYKILQIIFDSEYALKLSFLGGTCLRIVHGNTRFSEDIDFDNFDLKEEDFEKISLIVKKGLENEGYIVEIRNVYKAAFNCYIKMPGVLFENKLSGHKQEVILIQLDTAPHNFKYTPDKPILNKFDVFTQIYSTPLDIILSQKIYAVFNRKAPKGRDFFDIVFLSALTKPNYKYLNEKLNIKDQASLKNALLFKINELDMDALADDVESFLFNSTDSKKVKLFKEFVSSNF